MGRAGQSGFLRAVLLAGLAAWLVSGSALAQAPLDAQLAAAADAAAVRVIAHLRGPDDGEAGDDEPWLQGHA